MTTIPQDAVTEMDAVSPYPPEMTQPIEAETLMATAAPLIVDMVDTIHSTAIHIPPQTLKVGGYVTGSTDIRWTADDWGRFDPTVTGTVQINQANLSDPLIGNILDIEAGAWTIPAAIGALKARQVAGRLMQAYTGASNVDTLEAGLRAAGVAPHEVFLWMANWNLSRAQAIAALRAGHPYFNLVAIQWASPSSNPTTPLPGSNMDLQSANCDLSVAFAAWQHPRPAQGSPPPPPPVEHGYLLTGLAASASGLSGGNMAGRIVTSTDGGKSWH